MSPIVVSDEQAEELEKLLAEAPPAGVIFSVGEASTDLGFEFVHDLPSQIAVEVMGLKWAQAATGDEQADRYGDVQTIAARILASQPAPSADGVRDMNGETVLGFRVAAYRETDPEHGSKYGYHYSVHWSTPNWSHPNVRVERLFTEDQLRAALASQPAPVGDGVREVLAGQIPEEVRQKVGRVVAGIIFEERWDDLTEDDQGTALQAGEAAVMTCLDALAAPKAAPAPAPRKKPLRETHPLAAHKTGLALGLHRVFWKDGGSSLAVVGMLPDGRRWLGAANWLSPMLDPTAEWWGKIERTELIASYPENCE